MPQSYLLNEKYFTTLSIPIQPRASAQTHNSSCISFKQHFFTSEHRRKTRTMKSILYDLARFYYYILSNSSKISLQKSFYSHLHFDRWSDWLPFLCCYCQKSFVRVNYNIVFKSRIFVWNDDKLFQNKCIWSACAM